MISMLFVSGIAFGQDPMDHMPPPNDKIAAKIEAQKVAFITRILDLTPEEAQKFWPLYNEYNAKERELRPNFKKQRPKDISEEEANELIDNFFDNEQKRLNLTKNYYEKFKMILPAKKVVKLHFAERRFKEELLKRIKERRDKRRRR
jgi:hypothetical protein